MALESLEKRQLLSAANGLAGIEVDFDISGEYSYNGQSTQIVQMGSDLTFINENGSTSSGCFTSETEVVAEEWGGLVGTISNGDIDWDNGANWENTTSSIPGVNLPNLEGDYTFNGQPTRIEQVGAALTFVNERGNASRGSFTSATEVVAEDWGGLVGTISNENVEWDNGGTWQDAANSTPDPTPTPTPDPDPDLPENLLDLAGEYSFNGRSTHIEQMGSTLTFINENSNISRGRLINESQFVADDWGGLVGTIRNGSLVWEDGGIWQDIDSSTPDEFAMFTADLENELLIVRGGDGADKVHLRQSSDGSSIEVGTQSFRNEDVKEIVIIGDAGDDVIIVDEAIGHKTLIFAGFGSDIVYGGGGPDEIYGAQGNDTINGRGGNDIIWGGATRDVVTGDAGSNNVQQGSPNRTHTMNQFELDIVRFTNEAKVANGLPALEIDPQVAFAAKLHTDQMDATGRLDHRIPGVRFPRVTTRYDYAGSEWSSAGEALTTRGGSAEGIVAGWLAFPDTFTDLMRTDTTTIGVYTVGGAITAAFGRPCDDLLCPDKGFV